MSALKYGFDRDGGFFAVDLDARIGCYAFPGSQYAKAASANDHSASHNARKMIADDIKFRNAVGDSKGFFEAAFSRNLKRVVHAVVTSPAVQS